MCNHLHEPVAEIPEEGTGWKFFAKRFDGSLVTLVGKNPYSARDGAVEWYSSDEDDAGFCFFLDLNEVDVEFVKKSFEWPTHKVVLRKINYTGGLGEVYESQFIPGTCRIALCKSFSLNQESCEEGEHL